MLNPKIISHKRHQDNKSSELSEFPSDLNRLFVLMPKEMLEKKKLENKDSQNASYENKVSGSVSDVFLKDCLNQIQLVKSAKDGDTFIFKGTKITLVELKEGSYESGSRLGELIGDSAEEKIGCLVLENVNLEKFVEACILKQAKYKTYKSDQQEKGASTLYISVHSDNQEQAKEESGCNLSDQKMKELLLRCEGVLYARKLTDTPPNLLRPSDLEREALELEKLGVKVQILKGQEIEKMGCLRGVGQGSTDEPRLIVLQWKPVFGPSVGLVGKGVTFDSGGYSIKTPSIHMEDMKTDMSGAGLVLATIRTAAKLNLQHNIVGCMACVENMISGNSYRPGDILQSLSGKTVEVLNTDAEGRLILADALTYMQQNFELSYLLDFATLTGAIVVALGEFTSGFFCNDEKLTKLLEQAAQETAEPIWRMPMGKQYDSLLDSDIADMKNISGTRDAGSIVAAQFLGRFVEKKTRWAHFDIAGTAYTKAGSMFSPKYGSGVCLRMLLRFMANNTSEGTR